MEFELKLNHLVKEINENLNFYLEKNAEKNIYEPMQYSVNAGGKRFRPILFLSIIDAFGKDYKDYIPFAVSIEFIHTYSLIHDDLPAMDNDDFRRGMPTCHKKFGEAMGILAGDALLNIAFEIMTEYINENFEKKYVKAMLEIAKASGSRGMIGGQVADIFAENNEISKEELLYIHENKTGKLIMASIISGAIISNANEKEIEKLKEIGYKLGIAFQIQDDILDITGKQDIIGKPILSDVKNNKTTYVSINGLEKANKDYKKLSEEALLGLKELNFENKFIYKYISKLINREK
ncbi:MAG: polyprenyl synthetase family protein [Eubacteriales bacterium]|nr:polyprenyl synthetase family protein [Eubacteriales bacterium]